MQYTETDRINVVIFIIDYDTYTSEREISYTYYTMYAAFFSIVYP